MHQKKPTPATTPKPSLNLDDDWDYIRQDGNYCSVALPVLSSKLPSTIYTQINFFKEFFKFSLYTANVCRDLQGLCGEIGVRGFQIYGDYMYTVLHMFRQVLFGAGNKGNHQKKLRSFDMEKFFIVFYCLFWYISYIKTKLNTYPCIQMFKYVIKRTKKRTKT